jgi:hypothetical protein
MLEQGNTSAKGGATDVATATRGPAGAGAEVSACSPARPAGRPSFFELKKCPAHHLLALHLPTS